MIKGDCVVCIDSFGNQCLVQGKGYTIAYCPPGEGDWSTLVLLEGFPEDSFLQSRFKLLSDFTSDELLTLLGDNNE